MAIDNESRLPIREQKEEDPFKLTIIDMDCELFTMGAINERAKKTLSKEGMRSLKLNNENEGSIDEEKVYILQIESGLLIHKTEELEDKAYIRLRYNEDGQTTEQFAYLRDTSVAHFLLAEGKKFVLEFCVANDLKIDYVVQLYPRLEVIATKKNLVESMRDRVSTRII